MCTLLWGRFRQRNEEATRFRYGYLWPLLTRRDELTELKIKRIYLSTSHVKVLNVYGSHGQWQRICSCAESRENTTVRSWHVQSRLAERGGKWRPTPFSPGSLSMRPFANCCGASYGSRPPRWGSLLRPTSTRPHQSPRKDEGRRRLGSHWGPVA